LSKHLHLPVPKCQVPN